MEEVSQTNGSLKLSDKQRSFKIKSKTSSKQSHMNSIGLEQNSNSYTNSSGMSETKPVYEKLFVADAKGYLISVYGLSYKQKIPQI